MTIRSSSRPGRGKSWKRTSAQPGRVSKAASGHGRSRGRPNSPRSCSRPQSPKHAVELLFTSGWHSPHKGRAAWGRRGKTSPKGSFRRLGLSEAVRRLLESGVPFQLQRALPCPSALLRLESCEECGCKVSDQAPRSAAGETWPVPRTSRFGAGSERQEHIACAVGVSRPASRQHDDDHPAKLIVSG